MFFYNSFIWVAIKIKQYDLKIYINYIYAENLNRIGYPQISNRHRKINLKKYSSKNYIICKYHIYMWYSFISIVVNILINNRYILIKNHIINELLILQVLHKCLYYILILFFHNFKDCYLLFFLFWKWNRNYQSSFH